MIIVNRAGVVAEETASTPVVVSDGPSTQPLSWSWTSWTGETWDLTDLSSPVVKLRGATGAGPAGPDHFWSDAPLVDGSSWDGVRVGRGSVFLPLMVRGSDSTDFLDQHSRFMRSLDPRREGSLAITRPGNTTRTIGCRYESGADLAIDLDPVMARRAVYGITWATGDPYWSGDPVSVVFSTDPPSPLFPGPPFAINPGRTTDSATITNPGDVDSYPVWRVSGPFTGFTVGIGGRLVRLTVTKLAGQWVEIDTAPMRRTMLDDAGADMWLAATAADFGQIPSGVDTPITISVDGATLGSSVSLSFTPRYRSAWA